MKSTKNIGIIVHAQNQSDALEEAQEQLRQLFREETFRSWDTFESNYNLEGYRPAVLPCDSHEGKEFIEEYWQYTLKAFSEALNRMKSMIEYLSLEQIMEENVPENLGEDIKRKLHSRFDIRDIIREVSNFPRILWYLYFDYKPIDRKTLLEQALKPEEGSYVYVVPAEVSYNE